MPVVLTNGVQAVQGCVNTFLSNCQQLALTLSIPDLLIRRAGNMGVHQL